jgi:preprotein translocase subunit SecB
MADKKTGKEAGNGGAPKAGNGGNGGPRGAEGLPDDAELLDQIEAPVIVQGQYLRDLSFESPNAPESLQMMSGQPDINVEINVKPQKVGDNDYEVTLYMKVTAEEAGKSLFIVECDYAGLFTLQDVPEEAIDPIVAIEAPRLLFPFTRNIIADAIREGGFPPLLIQPIDFVSLYEQQMAAEGGEGFPPLEQG